MTLKRALLVVALGAACVVAASLLLRGSIGEDLALAAIAGLAAVSAGAAGTLVLHLLRARGLALQAAVVTLTPVAAVAAGALAAQYWMFASPHHLAALTVVLIASGTVAVLVALLLGHMLERGSEQLVTAARQIAEGRFGDPVEEPPTEELAALARELEALSSHLDASRRREGALEAARRELVAWVSHDLRTPIARVRALVEALEDGVVSDEATVRSYHERIRQEANRLGALVDDLFDLSTINAGALNLSLEPTSLSDLVSDLVAAFGASAERRGVTLEAPAAASDLRVDASMPHLERALGNVIDNAVRMSHRGGVVRIELETDENSATVCVSDSCDGIPAEDLERIFEPGYARQAARTLAGSGSGLGLAIARGLIEAHSGSVAVENDAEVGCRFRVRLPTL